MEPTTSEGRPPDRPPGAVALSVQRAGVSFRGLRALDAVTFDVPVGGVSAVIGPNGAGKTTLFNCISGLYRHDGRISLYGDDITSLDPHARASRGIARTFQTPVLLDELPVLDNVMLGGHARTRSGVLSTLVAAGRHRAEERRLREDAERLLDAFGIAHLADVPAGTLPHGDRRRTEVARAVMSRPRLLLLDEPAAGLGADESRELLEVALAACEDAGEGPATALLVEHDMDLVMSVARFVVVLDAGRLLTSGTPRKVAADPRVVAAYLGADAEEAAEGTDGGEAAR
ncbi:ABC transporter ATP-binding protein [Actinomadura opuntiae]|uniref:ABC transporter ATP-binding protein n=1 Tax=Actinomadura sp. OS1-43 TaxID=604315 RepID=UPI00255B0926|nr:ABC transporter ATP-binding protein [Actinomadura sp. OS1-43]MDL4817310.1 ABC transporter ATP-binding protein [Actinomadura sp. OS1-43]